ncbi:putative Peroxidase 48 [Euphorbia lathyris]|uniref:putative Peroxidase 48 n=1 Tax=Euphorbia lathyris TaxID=212925 RepID=UPI0033138934
MATSIFEASIIRRMSLLLVILCVLFSFKDKDTETEEGSSSVASSWDLHPSIFMSTEDGEEGAQHLRSLEYDFYRDSCPQAEKIIREMVQEMYNAQPSVAPALLRLAFHDCFIEGCDASILLDNSEGIKSEKDAFPNQSLKGFRIIDIIKSRIEETCPGVVSCADTVVLSAREGIMQAGGPFYPLFTGRRDSTQSFPDTASSELPSPQADLSETLASFASRGFDERETVSVLGAHSIGMVHCKFIRNRIYNFSGTNKPDPSLDPKFLNELRSSCNGNHSSFTPAASPSFQDSLSPSMSTIDASPEASTSSGSPHSPASVAAVPYSSMSSETTLLAPFGGPISSGAPSVASENSPEDPGINMAYEGPGVDFGTLYYRRLLQGRGILFSDQQLMAGEDTGIWVKAYTSNVNLFRRDFAMAMMKLSNLNVLTGLAGQVRVNCSKLA